MSQWKDPIVEEIHRVREEIAKECGYDLKRLMEMLRKEQAKHPERVVRREDIPKAG